jgi:stress-induced-phosphoprotein 1
MQAQGNAAFSNGDYTAAIKHFTAAIELDPSNHVLYSNRSAAEASP